VKPSQQALIGYTLATGRLFCDFADFHAYAERLLGRPVWTHEFADAELWRDLREAFEAYVHDPVRAGGADK
jgi:hypothetical protein